MADSRPPLYDHNGRPIQREEVSKPGIRRNEDGTWTLDAAAMAQIQVARQRRASLSRVPTVPSNMFRDVTGTVTKGHGRNDQVDLRTLRRLRERSPIIQAIHQARQYQVRRLVRKFSGKRGDVGWRIVHKDHTELGATPPRGFEQWTRLGEQLISRPSDEHCPTFVDALIGLEEDLLTINRPIVEPLHSLADRKLLVGWKPVDGGIILPTFAWLDKWLTDNPAFSSRHKTLSHEQALDIISGVVGHDLFGAKWALVRDGMLEQTYTQDELIVAPLLNRTDITRAGYPPSAVEQALEMLVAFINTWEFNTGYFTHGWMPEFLLGIKGDYGDTEVDAVVDMLRENAMGVGNAWKPLVLPVPEGGGIDKIDLKPSNREMMFEVWMSALIALTTAVYRMDTSVVNAKPWDGGGGGSLSEPSRLGEINLANEDGLQGDIGHLTSHIVDPLLARMHPDLRCIWEWGDYDPKKEAETYEVQCKTGLTRNEVRLAMGMKPKGYWVSEEKYPELDDEKRQKYDENPWNMPSDPAFANLLTQRAQMKQQKEMMEKYGGDPSGGQDPSGGGGDGSPGGDGDDKGFGGPPDAFPFGQMGGKGTNSGAGPPGPPKMAKALRTTIVHVHERR